MTEVLKQVVFVDDDEEHLSSLINALRLTGLDAKLHGSTNAETGLALVRDQQPHVLVSDLSIDACRGPESGFDFIRQALAICPTARCIVLTGHGNSDYGIRAIELGAANFLQKPPHLEHLKVLIEDGFVQSELRRERDRLLTSNSSPSQLVGRGTKARELRAQIEFAARSSQTVLLLGETGTGKGLCAQEIHRLSARKEKNFVRYQPCFGAHDLIQSDLFGHEKGAFTGALHERRGLIKEAEGGTFFLDEVDALPLETQVLLLGALQDRIIRRVGSDKNIEVNFRWIAACNSNLTQNIERGTFRQDLYHRIAHCVITLAPLRERLEDIPDLVEAIVAKLVAEERIQFTTFDASALDVFASHRWPGNVRELEAAVESAALRAQYAQLSVVSANEVRLLANASEREARSFSDRVEMFKQKMVRDALSASGNNQSKAAELLQIDRSSLRRVLGRSE